MIYNLDIINQEATLKSDMVEPAWAVYTVKYALTMYQEIDPSSPPECIFN